MRALLALLLLPACADIPSFGPETEASRAPYPQLMPIDDVLARGAQVTISAEDTAALEARAAALRARAARLRRQQPGA